MLKAETLALRVIAGTVGARRKTPHTDLFLAGRQRIWIHYLNPQPSIPHKPYRLAMDAITTQLATKNLDGLIEKVIADLEPTIVCTDSGQKAVLMSLDEFNSWQETLYLLSNPANAAHLALSIEEAKAGKLAEKTLIEP